jgi:hypothetical protein
MAKMRLLRTSPLAREQRKAFYIIPNYRQKCGWLRWNESAFGGGVETHVLRGQFAYNFDYVICCGIKASEKLRTSFGGKCLF